MFRVFHCLFVACVVGLLVTGCNQNETKTKRKVKIDRPGGGGQKIAPPKITFTNVTQKAGITFRHVNGATGKKLLPETMGSGVAFFDYDNDGDTDLLFVNSCAWPGAEVPEKPLPTMKLYRNRGNGTFDNVTKGSGLDITFYGMGATVGDFDNDGWPDVFVTGIGHSKLFRNVGDGKNRRFLDVTNNAGDLSHQEPWPPAGDFLKRTRTVRFSSSAAFLDYDNDGRLDLFVCNYVSWSPQFDISQNFTLDGIERAYGPPKAFQGSHCMLYHNEGNGKFKDVTIPARIQVTGENNEAVGKSLGVCVCDIDDDGFLDIVVANDTVPNFVFHNLGNGTFKELGKDTGVARPNGKTRGAMGIDWGRYRTDKHGILIGNYANEPNALLSLDNPKKLLFFDMALAEGIAGDSRTALVFGIFFFDYDLDGRLDFLSCNGHLEPEIHVSDRGQTYHQPAQLYWNTGNARRRYILVPIQFVGPDLVTPIVGRGSAFGDMDGDGDLDVVMTENGSGGGRVLLLRNNMPKNTHHWLRLRLHGDGRTTNSSAIGAQVTLHIPGEKPQLRTVTSARGYLSQSEFAVTFGLGKHDKIDRVEIRWPNRERTFQTLRELKVDQLHNIKQNVK